MFKVGGYRPSTDEINCEKFSAKSEGFIKLAATQADSFVIPEFTAISNQGRLSSCVANATADCLEMLKGLEDPTKVEQVSRLFIYYNARNYTQETQKDDGCFIHNALDSLTKLGACRESAWVYDQDKVFTRPTLEAYREGNDNSIVNFYQITSGGADRLKDIDTALKSLHPVIFGTRVSKEFQDYYSTTEKVFGIPDDTIGSHAMIIVGMRANSAGHKDYLVRNSWGIDFGMQGHCWLSADYINWSATQDLFVPTLMPDFVV